jgi:hypothetical protein
VRRELPVPRLLDHAVPVTEESYDILTLYQAVPAEQLRTMPGKVSTR